MHLSGTLSEKPWGLKAVLLQLSLEGGDVGGGGWAESSLLEDSFLSRCSSGDAAGERKSGVSGLERRDL